MTRFAVYWALNAAALAIAAALLGTNFELAGGAEGWDRRIIVLALTSVIFTVVNLFIGPIIKILAIPFIVVSFGLALLAINAGLLLLTEWLAGAFSLPMEINGFWWAVVAAIVISISNGILQAIFGND